MDKTTKCPIRGPTPPLSGSSRFFLKLSKKSIEGDSGIGNKAGGSTTSSSLPSEFLHMENKETNFIILENF